MLIRAFTFATVFLISLSVHAVDGMVNVKSKHSVGQTADRFENILNDKGMTVFKRISHSQGASKVGIELRPTEVIIFGNPKVGSPLMQCAQSVAIDLPQKALIWQDENKVTWISYNDPDYLRQRHAIEGCDEVLAKVSGALSKLTAAAAR